MAQDLVINNTGQVFRKLSDGQLQYVGTEAEVKAQRSTLGAKTARVAEGIAKRGLLGMPKFMADAIYEGGNVLEKYLPVTPESMKVPMMRPSEAIETFTGGPAPKGDTLPERLLIETGGGALEGGAIGPAVAAANKWGPAGAEVTKQLAGKVGAITGAGAGLGSETSAAAFGDTALNRVVGALVGGIGSYPAARYATGGGVGRRVNEVLKHTPDTELAVAQDQMASASQEGLPLHLEQAMVGQPSTARALTEDAARSTVGPKHTMFMAAQTPAARITGEKLLGMFKLGRESPTDLAETVQKAATGAIERAERFPAQIAGKHYAFTTEEVPAAELQSVHKQLRATIAEYGPTTPEGKFLINELYAPVFGSFSKPQVRLRRPEQIDSVMKAALEKLEDKNLASTGITDRIAGRIRTGTEGSYGKLLESLRANEPMGDALYRAAHKGIIDPMYRGPAGKLAGRQGFDPQEGTKVDQVFKVLDDKNLRAQQILRLQAQLDKESPGLFARYARAAIERKLDAAFKPGAEGTPIGGASRFAEALWGGAHQQAPKENFRATMYAVARSQGKSQQQSHEFVRGMEKLVSIIELSGRGKVTKPLEATDFKGLAVATDIARGAVYAPQAPSATQQVIEGLMGKDRVRRQIFELIWSPEGMDQVRKFARMSLPDIRSAMVATVGASAGQAEGEE